ncbi:MAG TPA: formate/nitrite transporter family protein [Gemmatimonadales bacterium]|nr:formate/nitrite transporter family protein [Gemmatimonadales bacterium]
MSSEQPESGTRLTAVEIHDNILEPAQKEIERPAAALLWSAVASGLVIGFSFLAAGFASHLASEPYRHAAAAAAYPLGFIFVIMARSELFTENTLVPVIPFLERRDRETFGKLLRMWGLLLAGNMVGALIFGWVLANTQVVQPELRPALDQVAASATSGGFGHVLYAGVFGGWLIALLAWLLASTQSTAAQIVFIWLCTAPIHALSFRHSIAGSVEAFYLAAGGQAPWGAMLADFVVPSVIGNAIGGVLLVALLNYGQVAPEKEDEKRKAVGR